MTPFETLIVSLIIVAVMTIGFFITAKVIDVLDKKIEQENEANKERFRKAIQAIHDAETLEEKIFRSDPDNDGKPFIKRAGG